MDYFRLVQQVTNYIETHLEKPLCVDGLAKVACCSKAHFCRIFCRVTGVSVMAYVRGRRLSLAGRELALNQAAILDLASQHNYENPEAFSKAFKRFHGVSPGECKRSGTHRFLERFGTALPYPGGEDMLALNPSEGGVFLFLDGDTSPYSPSYFLAETAQSKMPGPSLYSRTAAFRDGGEYFGVAAFCRDAALPFCSWFVAGGMAVVCGDPSAMRRFLPTGKAEAFHSDGSWAHLQYAGSHGPAQMGWYFPQEATPSLALTEAPKGAAWAKVAADESGAVAYALLPNVALCEVSAFAQRQQSAQPHYVVLRQEKNLHAVYFYDTGVLMVSYFAQRPVLVTSPGTGISYTISAAGQFIIREKSNGRIHLGMQPVLGAVSVTVKARLGVCLTRDAQVTAVRQLGGDMIVTARHQWNLARHFGMWNVRIATITTDEEIPIPPAVQGFAVAQVSAFSADLKWKPPKGDYTLLNYLLRYESFGTVREISVPGDQSQVRIFPLPDGAETPITIIPQNFGQGAAARQVMVCTPACSRLPIVHFDAPPVWEFNANNAAGNTFRVDAAGGFLALTTTTDDSMAEAHFPCEPVTSGLLVFSCEVCNPAPDRPRRDYNSINLIGTVNGLPARVATVMSEYGLWRYEIQRSFAPGTGYVGANHPRIGARVKADVTAWNEIRFLVDFDQKHVTVLVNGAELVYQHPFRHVATDVTNASYSAITGFNVLTRYSGASTVRIKNMHITKL